MHSGTIEEIESQATCLKYRYITAFVGFMAFFFLSGYRLNTSVNIVAMVNNSVLSEKTKSESNSCPDLFVNATFGKNTPESGYDLEEGEFNWSPQVQGYILGCYYLIFLIVQIPVGRLVERYGFKWFLFWGTTLASMSTLAVPLASRVNAYALIALQLLRGIGHGVYPTTTSVLTANWFPKMERGFLYASMQSGISIGACLGSIFSGLLCKSAQPGGWKASFYVFGAAGLVLAIAIAYFIHESPSVHPKISQEELEYILNNQENALSRRRPKTPWGEILRSAPVYALMYAYFGQLWALSQFLIVHSTFLGTILHYPIKQNGFFSAVPFLIMFLCSQISSWISSFVTNNKYASVNHLRKFWNFICCLGFSACFLGMYFVGCDKSWSIAFSVISTGFLGLGLSGCWIVSADMSPTFAASIKAVCFTFGSLPTFLLPVIVGYLTNEMQTIEQWNKIFFVAIGVVMTSGIIFSVFGSAEVQPWNFVKDATRRDKDCDTKF